MGRHAGTAEQVWHAGVDGYSPAEAEAALRAGTSGASKDPALEISGMVGLAVCHQYDVLRKRMLINGVSEERLALIGLKGLENEQIPVSRMVDPHRMDRF